MSKQRAHLHTVAKTSVKFQNDWPKTVGGGALTRHSLSIVDERTNGRVTARLYRTCVLTQVRQKLQQMNPLGTETTTGRPSAYIIIMRCYKYVNLKAPITNAAETNVCQADNSHEMSRFISLRKNTMPSATHLA